MMVDHWKNCRVSKEYVPAALDYVTTLSEDNKDALNLMDK